MTPHLERGGHACQCREDADSAEMEDQPMDADCIDSTAVVMLRTAWRVG